MAGREKEEEGRPDPTTRVSPLALIATGHPTHQAYALDQLST